MEASSGPIAVPGLAILPTPALPTPTATPPADPVSSKLDTAEFLTSLTRGLYAREAVPRELITREQLTSYVVDELDEEIDEIEERQQLYRLLGVIDADVVLYDLLLSLYQEGVLGFFDTEEERLYVVKDTEELTPRDLLTYTHEYTHGLQQQHFDIHSKREQMEDNSDEELAYRGLIEGDASISERLYLAYRMSEEEQASAQQASQGASLEAFDAAPHLIQRLFTFPYVEGFQFAVALFTMENTWDSINDAYEKTPRSTEHILHVEKYHAGEEPRIVEAPDLAAVLGEGWTELTIDTLGEFFLSAYLETQIPPERASAAAGGWGGDRFVVLTAPGGQSLMTSLITWDTVDDALEFHEAIVDFMEIHAGGQWEPQGPDAMAQVMSLAEQAIYADVQGADTVLVIAPDRAALDLVRASLAATE